ncbi:MAG: LytTR family DNA-binding domain-containing protein [Clostridiales bacterium]|nr:LytTR family DNA-binding domain-containing protein [Clostridiales bacterium]
MIYRIAVCDNDTAILQQIAAYLEQIQKETGHRLEVFYFSSGEDLLAHMPEDTHILLLDIGMGSVSGMDAARKLRERGWNFYLAFITSMPEFALAGYEVHAFGFICKPIQYAPLLRLMRDIFSLLDKKPAALVLDVGKGKKVFQPEHLLYAEVFQHETRFVTDQEVFLSRIPLADIEEKLQQYGFFRCHKSYLVNLGRITHIATAEITVDNGDCLPLSKHRRKEFLDTWSTYMRIQF